MDVSLKHSKKLEGLNSIPKSGCDFIKTDFLLPCLKADYDVNGKM